MITSQQVLHLANLRSPDHLISSLYLRLWPDPRMHQTQLKDLIRDATEELRRGDRPPEKRRTVGADLKKVQDFVESIGTPSRHALVVFSCAAEELWEVFFLSRPVRDLLVLDSSAYIRPLTGILDQYRRVCTLLVDRTHARICEVFMGEIEEQTEILSSIPPGSEERRPHVATEKKTERHIQEHLHDHVRKVADQVFLHFRRRGFDWLLVGGHDEAVSELERTLHSYLRKRLKKTFRMDLKSSPKEVLDKTLELEHEVKKDEDRALVSRLAESLEPGGLGVTGIEETLSVLHEGRVHTLLVEEGYSQRGAYCPKCGFMGLLAGSCPMCGGAMSSVPDIVDEAIAAAIDQSCEVSHVTPGCGLAVLGSMGALLRYR